MIDIYIDDVINLVDRLTSLEDRINDLEMRCARYDELFYNLTDDGK